MGFIVGLIGGSPEVSVQIMLFSDQIGGLPGNCMLVRMIVSLGSLL